MLKLNFDLHTHSRFSPDGISEPELMVAVARKKGLHGFAITDHNTCACVDHFIQLGMMREDGLPVDGFLIIPGQEISTSAGHLLALGVRIPDLKGIPPDEAIELIHQQGGLAIPPHPYDLFRAGIREELLQTLPIDGIEIFNAANTLKRYNEMAEHFAKRHQLPMTSGSDAHHEDAIGIAYTILHAEEFHLRAVLESIKCHRSEHHQQYMTARDTLKKSWSNLFRFKKKPRKSAEHLRGMAAI